MPQTLQERRGGWTGRALGWTALLALLLAPVVAAGPAAASTAHAGADPADHPLDWLIGDWQAEFRPPGDEQPAPTMRFEWRDEGRRILTITGTRPAPGGKLVPEYETTVVWHPVKERWVFLGAYLSGESRVTEDGEIEILEDGSVRLLMNVHYPSGVTVPFTDEVTAGPAGHTLHFRRTFRQAGPDQLRGVFRILRDGAWEDPHPQMSAEDGYPWRRIATDARASRAEPLPAWVLEHWERLVGTWVADNSAYRSDTETTEAYGLDWSWGIDGKSLEGRLYGIQGGEETATYWEFREFWHPAEGHIVTEQFGAGGTYGSGPQTRLPDGSLEMEQTFYYPSAGATARVGHRATLEGDLQTTASFDIDETGEWRPRRSYVWRRQPAAGSGE